MSYILLIIGLIILIKGADTLVDGASSFAKKMGISPLVIGLTVVAFGTSAPELFVNSFSAFKGETGIAIGNVVGSNIMNILLILGLAAIVYPLMAKKSTYMKEIPFAILGSLVLMVLLFDSIFSGAGSNILSLGDGIILLAFFILFIVYTFGISKNGEENSELIVAKEMSKGRSVVFMALGILGLALGAELLVRSATQIAESFGVSELFIGLTIVAIGTSLPELVTSVVASMKKSSDIAIGNIVGSNIFNIFFILGVTVLISPIEVENKVLVDVGTMLGVTVLLLLSLFFVGKKGEITKIEGSIFILLYIIYTVYLISSQMT